MPVGEWLSKLVGKESKRGQSLPEQLFKSQGKYIRLDLRFDGDEGIIVGRLDNLLNTNDEIANSPDDVFFIDITASPENTTSNCCIYFNFGIPGVGVSSLGGKYKLKASFVIAISPAEPKKSYIISRKKKRFY